MRELAKRIVKMRRLLMTATIAGIAGRADVERSAMHMLDDEAQLLPLSLRFDRELVKRIGDPVRRKIEREGILAQQNVRRSE